MMMMPSKMTCSALVLMVLGLVLVSMTDAAPRYRNVNPYYNELDEVPDDVLMDLMARFGRTIMRAHNDVFNSKRTVDFGLNRGYSGAQEAKLRMGMEAASFPGGPGRRRRSEPEAEE